LTSISAAEVGLAVVAQARMNSGRGALMAVLKSARTADCQTADARFVAGLKRVAGTLWISAVVILSLLTFPSSIPWMIAVWLLGHTLSVLRGRPGWLPLAACAAIVLFKRVGLAPGLIALAAVILVAGFVAAIRARQAAASWPKRFAWAAVLALWLAWAAMALDWHAAAHCSRPLALQATRPVVCLGDSLTAGMPPHGGYPQDLQELVSLPVVNLSQPGLTSCEALGRLPFLVEANPQVVVVGLGGNDFVAGYSRESVKMNLEKIVACCRQIGSEVVLMEMPRGFVTDPFAGLEREIARRDDLELVPDTAVRKLVLWSPYGLARGWAEELRLSDDGLHPNRRGNRLLAECVAEALVRMYGTRIRTTGKSDQKRKPSRPGGN